jgi:hypothetical protein
MATRRWRPLPPAVARSEFSIALSAALGRRSRRPITSSRAPRSRRRVVCSRRKARSSQKILCTSVDGRRQLSDEKAYSVRQRMPTSDACSTMRRTEAIPARCPATRRRPLRAAQRPLPSMMMATCWGRAKLLCIVKSPCISNALHCKASGQKKVKRATGEDCAPILL